jgi:hypothetical protein
VSGGGGHEIEEYAASQSGEPRENQGAYRQAGDLPRCVGKVGQDVYLDDILLPFHGRRAIPRVPSYVDAGPKRSINDPSREQGPITGPIGQHGATNPLT